eukprot:TRINITY_DN15971_c0_g1_i1.p1 TRINITY_DN15971_c0_g1~~TRINITY_DN15971_c0_g1_i1.p1  ORF type:complete len:300 (-),score=64.15 TRINITY_DN15971_c0_g1_i1:42-941(-)
MAVQSGVDSQLNVSLHPLVILNISDHFMRSKASGDGKTPRTVGLICGTASGRNIEIFNTFECTFADSGDALEFDAKYLEERKNQFIQVYPDLEILGWYSTGTKVTDVERKTQQQIQKLTDSNLFLHLDPTVSPTVKELPVHIYLSQLRVAGDQASQVFIDLPFKIETEPAEGIAVGHIAKNTAVGDDTAARLQSHLSSIHTAIRMLGSRVKVLVNYLAAVKKGDQPANHAVMRQVNSLVRRMPALDTKAFQHEHMAEYNDAVLLAYLATLTKSTQSFNEVVDRFNMGFDRHSRRGRGMF